MLFVIFFLDVFGHRTLFEKPRRLIGLCIQGAESLVAALAAGNWRLSLVLRDHPDRHGASPNWSRFERGSTRDLFSEVVKAHSPVSRQRLLHGHSPVHFGVYQVERLLEKLLAHAVDVVLGLLESDGHQLGALEFAVACRTRTFREHRFEFGQLALLNHCMLLIDFDDGPVEILEKKSVLFHDCFCHGA